MFLIYIDSKTENLDSSVIFNDLTFVWIYNLPLFLGSHVCYKLDILTTVVKNNNYNNNNNNFCILSKYSNNYFIATDCFKSKEKAFLFHCIKNI